jgi:uncharacterized SAM-binding protein YcdF (DUF218 family)
MLKSIFESLNVDMRLNYSLFKKGLKGVILTLLVWFVASPVLAYRFHTYNLMGHVALFGFLIGILNLRWIVWSIGFTIILAVVIITRSSLTLYEVQKLIRDDALQEADAIIVLSSASTDEGRLDQIGVDRFIHALNLINRGYSKTLITSKLLPWYPSPEKDHQFLLSLFNKKDFTHIVLPHSGTTFDEALTLKNEAQKRGWNKVIVVTSPTHSKRAAAIFEAQGLHVISSPCIDRQLSLSTLKHPRERVRAFALIMYESFAWFKNSYKGRL